MKKEKEVKQNKKKSDKIKKTETQKKIKKKREEIAKHKAKLVEINAELRKEKLSEARRRIMVAVKKASLKRIEDLEEEIADQPWGASIVGIFLFFMFVGLIYSKFNVEQYGMYSNAAKFDFYDKLEIKRSADQADIKKSYKQLMIKYHPDKNPGCKDCDRRVYDIHSAFEVLSNPKKRKVYDQTNKVLQEITSAAVDLTYDNYEQLMEQDQEVRIVQIYDSSRAAQNFSTFFEDLQKQLNFIGFYRVHLHQQGFLLKKLPFSPPFSPFLYIERPQERESDILLFLSNKGMHSNHIMMSSFMKTIPKVYSKYPEKEWEQDPTLASKYHVRITIYNMSIQTNPIKAKIMYYAYILKNKFGLESVIIDSKKSLKYQIDVDFMNTGEGLKTYTINLRKIEIAKALDLVLKSVFVRELEQKARSGSLSILWREQYNFFCRSKLAKIINMRCFIVRKESQNSQDLWEMIQTNNLKISSKFSNVVTPKKGDVILNTKLDYLTVASTRPSRFNRLLKNKIRHKIEKIARMELANDPEGDSKQSDLAQTVSAKLDSFKSTAMLFYNPQEDEILVTKNVFELEDAYDQIQHLEIDFQNVFPETNLDGMFFKENDSGFWRFFRTISDMFFSLDLTYALIVGPMLFLRFWFKFSTKFCIGLFVTILLTRSLHEFYTMVLN